MYAWFRGTSSPNAEMLPPLAAALGLSPSELVAGLGAEVADAGGQSRRIGDVVSGPVAWCDADDAIGPVAHRLYEGNFSQMPVREDGRWTGLLTTEAIARWMAGRAALGLEVDERAPVREVIAYAEEADNFHVVGPGERAADVAKLFTERTVQGRPLAAVLVLEGESGELVGIVTPADWPSLAGIPTS
jgi:predicted transcriptional regulator